MALAWGRGERLLPLPVLDRRPVVLLVPDFSVATPDAYAWLAADRGTYLPTATVLRPESLATWEAIAALAENDFQRVVSRRQPVLGKLVDGLAAAGAALSMLSGSGSVVYGVFDTPPDPASITRRTGLTTITTQTSERVVRVVLDQ
jgi:4-diphosphocytidyl-2-C-methyl-D-erythritol kinase